MAGSSTILVAEDNLDDYLLIELAFARTRVPALLRHARNGLEAKHYLAGEARPFDRAENPLPAIILADLKMPLMTGFELLAWLRGQTQLRRIPVVFLTASGNSQDVNHAYDLGANSYLIKPARLSDLDDLVSNLRNYWLRLNQKPLI